MATVGEVLSDVAILCNDAEKILYTDTVTLPYFKMAYRELEVELHNNGAQLLDEVSGIIQYVANTTDLGSSQPSDLVIPVRLKERGSADDSFIDMEEKYWEPTDERGQTLQVWAFREGVIQLRGATQDREVIIYYYKSFSSIVDTESNIAYNNATNFLAPRAAALAALYKGNNPILSTRLDSMARENKDKLLSRTVRGEQALSGRRKSYFKFLKRNNSLGN